MSSQRLPGKALLPFASSSIIHNVLRRVCQSKSWSEVYLATSTELSDNPLANELARSFPAAKVFRGSLQNVFSRFQQIAEQSKVDHILRITGDCPLICPIMLDNLYSQVLDEKLDFASNSHEFGVLKGFDLEFMRRELLLEIDSEALTDYEIEHVTPYFYEKTGIKKKLFAFQHRKEFSNLNLSLDTPQDFELLDELERCFRVSQLTYDQIIDVLRARGSNSLLGAAESPTEF
jgi:spore coat polysaccharide biosynthesis protein SpsF